MCTIPDMAHSWTIEVTVSEESNKRTDRYYAVFPDPDLALAAVMAKVGDGTGSIMGESSEEEIEELCLGPGSVFKLGWW